MGIWGVDNDGQPTGTALVDTGAISMSSTGAKLATISYTLPAGSYLLYLVADTNGASIRAGRIFPSGHNELLGSGFGSSANVVTGVRQSIQAGGYYSGAATTPRAVSLVSSASSLAGDHPIIVLRWT